MRSQPCVRELRSSVNTARRELPPAAGSRRPTCPNCLEAEIAIETVTGHTQLQQTLYGKGVGSDISTTEPLPFVSLHVCVTSPKEPLACCCRNFRPSPLCLGLLLVLKYFCK